MLSLLFKVLPKVKNTLDILTNKKTQKIGLPSLITGGILVYIGLDNPQLLKLVEKTDFAPLIVFIASKFSYTLLIIIIPIVLTAIGFIYIFKKHYPSIKELQEEKNKLKLNNEITKLKIEEFDLQKELNEKKNLD